MVDETKTCIQHQLNDCSDMRIMNGNCKSLAYDLYVSVTVHIITAHYHITSKVHFTHQVVTPEKTYYIK